MHNEMGQLMPQGLVQDAFSRQQFERLQGNGLAIARGRHPSGLSRSADEFSHRGPSFHAHTRRQNLRVRAQFLSPLLQRIERLLHPGFLGGRVNELEVFAGRNRVSVTRGLQSNLRPGEIGAEDLLRRRSHPRHLLGARLAKSHTMAQPVPGEYPRISLALDCIKVAFDLLPAQAAVNGVTELIGINIPSGARDGTQNERPA